MTGNVHIKQNQKSEFYMLGPKIELIWTDELIKKYPSRKTRDKIAFEIFGYIDKNYFYDITDFPSSMSEHFRKLDYFDYLLNKRPVFTIEKFKKVFLVKFLELDKKDLYRFEINLTGSNIFSLKLK